MLLIVLLPPLLLLLAAWPGLGGPQVAAGQAPSATPKLVGQAYAQEWTPASDLSYLRPPKVSKDLRRPACELPAGSGKFNGVCTEDITEAPKLLSFCSDLVRYRACVPAHQVMWPKWNATAKDLLLTDLFKDMVTLRIEREMNVTPDMYVPIHYMANPNCIHALRNALCWYNFPKCNDLNRSMPLCTSTCNEYYSNCKYVPDAGGGFPGCSSGKVSTSGLFQSNVRPGPDQVLAEDRPEDKAGATCQRQPSDGEIGITPEEEDTAWYLTWWGICILILSGLVIIGLLGYLLIPPVLMEFLVKSGYRLAWSPFHFWMNLPVLKGNKVLASMAFVFLALLAVGAYQTMTGGFKRWEAWKETKEDAEFQFKPPTFIWGTQATKPLTNQQLRQLQQSCTCTGGAYRGLPDVLILAAAMCWLCLWPQVP